MRNYIEIFTKIICTFFDELNDKYRQEFIFRAIFNNCAPQIDKSSISRYLNHGFSTKFVERFYKASNVSILKQNIKLFLKDEVKSIANISQIYDNQRDIFEKYALTDIIQLPTKPLNIDKYIDYIVHIVEITCHTAAKMSAKKCPLKCFQPKKYDWFVGRKDELEKMQSLIEENSYVILHGFDGLGKTELAKRYMAEHSDEYDILLKADYCGNLKATIASLEIKGNLVNSAGEAANIILETINDTNNRVLLFIDNYTYESSAESIDDDIDDYVCDFIFATSKETSALSSESTLKVSELSSSELHELLKKTSGDSIGEEYIDDILKFSYNHTLLVDLIGKQLKGKPKRVQSVVDKLKSYGYLDINPHSSQSESKEFTTIKSHIHEILDIKRLSPLQRSVLTLFTLFPENHELDRYLAVLLFENPSVIDELVSLGWLSCNDINSYDSKYNMHPLLYHSMKRKNEYHPRFFSNLLQRITEFTAEDVTSCYSHNVSRVLFSICKTIHEHIKTRYTAEFKRATNGTVRWLAINGDQKMAYDLFSITNKKDFFTPTTYLALGNINDEAIIKGFNKSAQKKISYYCNLKNDFVKYLGDKEYKSQYESLLKERPCDKLDFDSFYFSVHINEAFNYINDCNYQYLVFSCQRISQLLYPYNSTTSFFSYPPRVQLHTMINFIEEQLAKKSLSDTAIYKTVTKICDTTKKKTGSASPAFYNSKILMKHLLLEACFILHLHQAYSTGDVSKLGEFILNHPDVHVSTKIVWYRELLMIVNKFDYYLEKYENFFREHVDLTEMIKDNPYLYLKSRICNDFCHILYYREYYRNAGGEEFAFIIQTGNEIFDDNSLDATQKIDLYNELISKYKYLKTVLTSQFVTPIQKK